jgi:hypothetical protein
MAFQNIPASKDYLSEVAKGAIQGHEIVTVKGHATVTTTLSPITPNLLYRTPTAPVALEVVSASVNDSGIVSGTLTLVSALADETVTVNGLVYTAVAGAKADNTEFSIDTDDTAAALDLADSINNDDRIGTLPVTLTAVPALGVVTITSDIQGSVGQSVTIAGDTNITASGATLAAGSGAQSVTVKGIGSNWLQKEQTVYLNGTAAVSVGSFLRVTSVEVSESGTYATQSAGSHAGVITLRVAAGGDTWATLAATPFPAGESSIGVYTVPKGKTAYIIAKNIFVDSTKSVDIYTFVREGADVVSGPRSAIKLIEKEIGVSGGLAVQFSGAMRSIPEMSDVGFMGVVGSSTAPVSCEMQLLIVDANA